MAEHRREKCYVVEGTGGRVRGGVWMFPTLEIASRVVTLIEGQQLLRESVATQWIGVIEADDGREALFFLFSGNLSFEVLEELHRIVATFEGSAWVAEEVEAQKFLQKAFRRVLKDIVSRGLPFGGSVPAVRVVYTNDAPCYDTPSCSECGALMVEHGACYKCLNCGATGGCL